MLRRDDSSCEGFFTSAHPYEQFFVKNLETVQGDERDVIFISVGYGRTAEGYLSMSFGPLNGEGGERRLNVLITRARLRCEVFTNITAADIDDKGKGAVCRRSRCSWDTPRTAIWTSPGGYSGNGLTVRRGSVCRAQVLGYNVRTQVGSAGFRIDLAMVDPRNPGRYLLGIECDGATYHSARSARDRDRLRQEVLENLGWRIHRIWSTDWFRDPDREVRRVVEAIQSAPQMLESQTRSESATHVVIDAPIVQRETRKSEESPPQRVPNYTVAKLYIRTGNRELYQVNTQELATWVVKIVQVESPVHQAEVARRIAEAVGVKRVGNRIEAAIASAVTHAAVAGTIRRQGSFLWRSDMDRAPVRDRGSLGTTSRKIDLIAPEELDSAIVRAVTDSFGIQAGEIAPAACNLLGFGRCSEDSRAKIDQRVAKLVGDGNLAIQGDWITLPSASMYARSTSPEETSTLRRAFGRLASRPAS